MVSFNLEDGRVIECPSNIGEITFGQHCDVLYHLHKYDARVKDENDLAADESLIDALAIVCKGDISSLPIVAEEGEASLDLLARQLQAAAYTVPEVEGTIEWTLPDGTNVYFNPDDYVNRGGTTSTYVETMALMASMPNAPFSSSDLTSAFYTLTQKQAGILFRAKGENLPTNSFDRDEFITKRGELLQDMPAHYVLAARNAVLNFMIASR